MELHQLRYAAEVARRGSFTAAADVLHVSQSGVSAQVAKLERELSVRLFERGARTATPTAEGGLLLEVMAETLDCVERVRAVADDLAGLVRGRVRVGTIIGCTMPGYLRAFADFRRSHPGVAVSAVEDNSDRLVADLVAGEIDVALVAHADDLPTPLDVQTLIDEPLAVGVAPGHALAGHDSVSVADLVGVDVLTLPAGTGVRTCWDKTCAATGSTIAPAVEAYSPDAVLALARDGVGAVVLSASMFDGSGLTTVGLIDSARNRLSLATRRSPNAAAREFAALLRAALRDG